MGFVPRTIFVTEAFHARTRGAVADTSVSVPAIVIAGAFHAGIAGEIANRRVLTAIRAVATHRETASCGGVADLEAPAIP